MVEWKRYDKKRKVFMTHTFRLTLEEDQEFMVTLDHKFPGRRGAVQHALYEAVAEWVKKNKPTQK